MIDIEAAKINDTVYVIEYSNQYYFKIYGTEILEIFQVPFYAYEYNDVVKPIRYQTQFKLKGFQEPHISRYMYSSYKEAKEYVFKKYDDEYLQKQREIYKLEEDIRNLKPLLDLIKSNELLEEIA